MKDHCDIFFSLPNTLIFTMENNWCSSFLYISKSCKVSHEDEIPVHVTRFFKP